MLSSPPGNHASMWVWGLWLKSVVLILANYRVEEGLIFHGFGRFFALWNVLGFGVFANQPTVLSRGCDGLWLWLLALVSGDRWHATHESWHITCDMCIFSLCVFFEGGRGGFHFLIFYITLRDSVSPICRNFSLLWIFSRRLCEGNVISFNSDMRFPTIGNLCIMF